MHVRASGLSALNQMRGVVVVERIGADQRVDQPLYLRQPKGVAERGALGPGVLKGRADVEIAKMVVAHFD